MYLILRWRIPILFSLKRASNDKIVFFVLNLSSYPPVNCLLLCSRESVKSTLQIDFANCRAGFSQKRTQFRHLWFPRYFQPRSLSFRFYHQFLMTSYWWLCTAKCKSIRSYPQRRIRQINCVAGLERVYVGVVTKEQQMHGKSSANDSHPASRHVESFPFRHLLSSS